MDTTTIVRMIAIAALAIIVLYGIVWCVIIRGYFWKDDESDVVAAGASTDATSLQVDGTRRLRAKK